MSLTNEQIKSIINLTIYDNAQYVVNSGAGWFPCSFRFKYHAVSDLKEILALRERVERLEEQGK